MNPRHRDYPCTAFPVPHLRPLGHPSEHHRQLLAARPSSLAGCLPDRRAAEPCEATPAIAARPSNRGALRSHSGHRCPTVEPRSPAKPLRPSLPDRRAAEPCEATPAIAARPSGGGALRSRPDGKHKWRRGEDLNPRGTYAPIRFRVGRLQPGSATPPCHRTLHRLLSKNRRSSAALSSPSTPPIAAAR